MTKIGCNLVKLYTYELQPKETIVDIYTAKEFEDFIIVNVKGAVTESQLQELANIFRACNKQILLVPEWVELEFYGVTEKESGIYSIPESVN